MDLQGLGSPVAEVVNPNIAVSVWASTGYTNTGKGYRQVPSYASAINGFAQVQALTSSELRQIEGLNLQGALRTIYFRGKLNGVIRPTSQGGDLVAIAGPTPTPIVLEDGSGNLWILSVNSEGQIVGTNIGSGTAPTVFLNDADGNSYSLTFNASLGNIQATPSPDNVYPTSIPMTALWTLKINTEGLAYVYPSSQWLVIKTLELWPTWSKALIQLQEPS